MSIADWSRRADETVALARTPPAELAQIMRRAAAIGIPAWRVTTALGLPSSDDGGPAGPPG